MMSTTLSEEQCDTFSHNSCGHHLRQVISSINADFLCQGFVNKHFLSKQPAIGRTRSVRYSPQHAMTTHSTRPHASHQEDRTCVSSLRNTQHTHTRKYRQNNRICSRFNECITRVREDKERGIVYKSVVFVCLAAAGSSYPAGSLGGKPTREARDFRRKDERPARVAAARREVAQGARWETMGSSR